MLDSPVAEETSTEVGKAATEDTLAICENERFGLVFVKTGSINSGTGENKSTAGLIETQKTTGTAGDANNSRDAKTGGNISKVIKKSRDATAGTQGS